MTAAPAAAPRGRLALALAALYLVWGSTYLAIRIAVESMPALGSAAIRFLTAGALLYALVRPGATRPTAAQWRTAAIVGVLLLAGGNGLVCVAERSVPSGVAAVVVATVPLWVTILPWLGGRPRPRARTLVGIALGLAGVAWLGWSPQAAGATLGGVLVLLAAALSWASGSLLSRRLTHAPSLWLATAMQMLCGGAALAVGAAVVPDGRPHAWTWASIAALAYLVVFGSMLGFGSYVWLLRHAQPAVATSYAYVNPLVAVLLGALFAGEPLGWPVVAPAALILVAVALILLPTRAPR